LRRAAVPSSLRIAVFDTTSNGVAGCCCSAAADGKNNGTTADRVRMAFVVEGSFRSLEHPAQFFAESRRPASEGSNV